MIPLRDNIRSTRPALLTWLLIATNVAVFFHELSLGEAVNEFIDQYGLIPWEMTVGIQRHAFSPTRHVLPWVSSMFVHGGWLHVIGNMWFLYIFGDNVEDRLGRGRYLALYLGGGLLAALAQVITSPGSTSPMVGASGAISAVVGAYLILYPRARVLTLIPLFILFYFAHVPAWIFIGLWFLLQLLSGTASLSDATATGVAWWAHIGGFLAGVIMAFILRIGTASRETVNLRRGAVKPWGGKPRGERQ